MLLVAVVCAVMVRVTVGGQNTRMVTLKQGAIIGSEERATNGRVYYSFLSIPYAKPPVGPLRFKDPEPAPGWTGIRNGTLAVPKCPQSSVFTFNEYPVEGQEDCLYLNVYTPRPYISDLAVMVYIHGGAFVVGMAADGDTPAPLLQKDVVVVAMNYRLGALGFLSTGDNVLPGNLGLKDQNLALRWVQDNIRDLGGDPNKVTIFGVSAGGISSHLHVLSPTSSGLFQRAILQSGTALLSCISTGRKGTVAIAKSLNCTGEESYQLLECFKNATVKELVQAQDILSVWHSLPQTVGPCVDGTFLPDHPAILLRTGKFNKVDLIVGSTKDDGNLITTGLFSKDGEEGLQRLNDDFNKIGPILFGVREEQNPVYLARRILLNYMTDFNVTLDDEPALANLIGDQAFVVRGAQSAEFHAKHHKTFMYELHHELEKSWMSVYETTFIKRPMAGHADDLMYMFQFPEQLLEPLHRPQDLHVQDTIVNLWTNFATTGNPTIGGNLGFRWTPVTSTGPLQYLSITTTPTMQEKDSQILTFWKHLPTKHSKLLYPELFLP